MTKIASALLFGLSAVMIGVVVLGGVYFTWHGMIREQFALGVLMPVAVGLAFLADWLRSDGGDR